MFSHLSSSSPVGAFRTPVDLAQAMIRESLERAKREQAERYGALQRDVHDLYDGEHFDVMKRHLAVTHPRVSERWNAGDGSGHRYLNVLEMMTRTLSVVFHRPPETYLTRDGERLPDDAPEAIQWRKDQRDIGWGPKLKQIDAWTVLFRTVLVQPAWVRGRVQWLVTPPYQGRVDQDLQDPASIDAAPAVHIELPQPTDTLGASVPARWTSWTYEETPTGAAWRMYLHQDGRLLANPLFPDNVNRYGQHPFVVFRDGTPAPGEFWLPAREPWFHLQRWLNVSLMDEAWGLKYQTWGVGYAKGWHENENPSMDPGEVITQQDADPNSDLRFITPQTNLGLLHAALDNALRWAAVTEGLPADIWTGLGATRNLAAKKMDAHHLMMRREERLPVYEDNMRRLWDAHRVVVNVHSGAPVYGPDLELVVKFAPIPYPVDEFQDAQRLEKEFALGLASPVQTLADRNPGLTLDDARELHERYLGESKASRPPPPPPPSFGPPPMPGPQPPAPPDMREVDP